MGYTLRKPSVEKPPDVYSLRVWVQEGPSVQAPNSCILPLPSNFPAPPSPSHVPHPEAGALPQAVLSVIVQGLALDRKDSRVHGCSCFACAGIPGPLEK